VDIHGESFSALTALNGPITVHGGEWSFELAALETILVPAGCGRYSVTFTGQASALLSHAAGE
jgi:hypothetical protein